MEVEVKGKKIEIQEILYKDVMALGQLPPGEMSKKILLLGTGITEEEFGTLNMKDGLKLTQAVTEFNGLTEDFQKTLSSKQS